MGKRLSFPSRSFGSDAGLPDTSSLIAWVSAHRGQERDLTSFLLEQELSYQWKAGVSIPCAGGKFYFDRWEKALTGTVGRRITAELGYDPVLLNRDATQVTSIVKGAWLTIPAPHLLSLKNNFFSDPDEVPSAIASVYQDMMRSGRDAHVAGHVLFCEQIIEEELEALAGRKAFFFSPDLNKITLTRCLEFQQIVAVKAGMLPILQDLMNEYEVSRIILLDPSENDLRQALLMRDRDQISCGGYCPGDCKDYWSDLVKKSSILT
jgi:hypothetical protein